MTLLPDHPTGMFAACGGSLRLMTEAIHGEWVPVSNRDPAARAKRTIHMTNADVPAISITHRETPVPGRLVALLRVEVSGATCAPCSGGGGCCCGFVVGFSSHLNHPFLRGLRA